jgi:hypothetical protein
VGSASGRHGPPQHGEVHVITASRPQLLRDRGAPKEEDFWVYE